MRTAIANNKVPIEGLETAAWGVVSTSGLLVAVVVCAELLQSESDEKHLRGARSIYERCLHQPAALTNLSIAIRFSTSTLIQKMSAFVVRGRVSLPPPRVNLGLHFADVLS
jgi:hypothetical protein